MDLKNRITIAVFAISVLFFGFFIHVYEIKWHQETKTQIADCASAIENSLWDLDHNAPKNYLKLLVEQNAYDHLTILQLNGARFIHIKGGLTSFCDRFFERASLIRPYDFTAQIHHLQEYIGQVSVVRYNDNIYLYLYVLLTLFLLNCLVWYVQGKLITGYKCKELNEQLDQKVKKRTHRLSELNKKYSLEIAERIRIAEALEESEKLFRTFFMLGKVGMAITSPAKDWIRVNHQLCDMLLFSEEELMKMTWAAITHPEDLAVDEDQFDCILKGKIDGYSLDKRFIRKDGSILHTTLWIACLRNNKGEVEHLIAHLLDNTERIKADTDKKKLEAQLQQSQKMEAIGTLAGGIAHDFNNTLSPIIGFTELLQEDLPQDSPFQENIAEILQAGLRAKDLVKQILTFSRQHDQELKPVKIQALLTEALKLLASSIPKTIDIKTEINPDCGPVFADPTQIHQVIMNLVTNAYHSMQKSGGQLTVVLKQSEIESSPLGFSELLPGKYALLKVIDTGTGIKKGVLDKIFNPYFTTKKVGKGTGLGLSVVQGIVKSCHGELNVYSEPGKGTEIHVYLPIIKKPIKDIVLDPSEPVQGGPERILIVDDEETIVKMEKRLLERIGYHVVTSIGSIEALKKFKSDPAAFDLVITDMTMPGMTGIQLSNEIKKIRPNIPLIICTGFSDQINAETSRNFGIQGYVNKPIIIKKIAKTIRDVLDK